MNTKSKSGRVRSDSAHFQAAMHAAAAEPPHEPPAHCFLPPAARPFWDALIVLKPRNFWTAADLETLVDLARLKMDIERLWREVDDEGEVVNGAQGGVLPNPKAVLLLKYRNQAISMTRAIRIDTDTLTDKDKQVVGKKLTAYAEARRKQHEIATASGNDPDSLLGGMH